MNCSMANMIFLWFCESLQTHGDPEASETIGWKPTLAESHASWLVSTLPATEMSQMNPTHSPWECALHTHFCSNPTASATHGQPPSHFPAIILFPNGNGSICP